MTERLKPTASFCLIRIVFHAALRGIPAGGRPGIRRRFRSRRGIGGGIARDVLVARVPLVLQAELYAIAALAGAAVVAIGHWLNLPSLPCALAGAGLCFGLRLMAMHFGWHLPVSLQGNSDDPPPADGPPR